MKGLIIEGSARKDGNTAKIGEEIRKLTGFEVVHLCEKNIAHFDYAFDNQDDDFFPLIDRIAEHFELIIFLTPVYWYSMSGMMKVFFDRISDCLKIHKETGRKLRGKYMMAISISEDDHEYEGFFMPFHNSALYLGMKYLGHIHTWIHDGEIPTPVDERIRTFLIANEIPLIL